MFERLEIDVFSDADQNKRLKDLCVCVFACSSTFCIFYVSVCMCVSE